MGTAKISDKKMKQEVHNGILWKFHGNLCTGLGVVVNKRKYDKDARQQLVILICHHCFAVTEKVDVRNKLHVR